MLKNDISLISRDQFSISSKLLSQKAKTLSQNSALGTRKLTSQEDETLKKQCAEFESLFVKMMLSIMRKSTKSLSSTLQGVSKQRDDFYYDLLDTEYAKSISQSEGGIGIGDIIYRQLTQPVVSSKEVAEKYSNS